jgi:hypothetical protein
MNALKMDFDEIFIRINLQKSEFFLIITVVAHDALLVLAALIIWIEYKVTDNGNG